MSWVIDGGHWQGPVRISPPGVAPKGSRLATAHQTDDSQLDVFFIGNDRGPIRISSSGRLFLGINDDNLHDNTGYFTVIVYY